MSEYENEREKRSGACCGKSAGGLGVNRRSVLTSLAVLATGAAAGRAAFAQTDPAMMAPQVGDYVVARLGDTPLTPDDIRFDSPPFAAWAMSPDNVIRSGDFNNQFMLFRYDPASLDPEIAKTTGDGVIALTLICTHAGCAVDQYQREEEIMECPCHGSQFDPKAGGALVRGPAVRKLPQLPLGVDADGKLVVAAVFDSRVGPDEFGVDDR